MLGGTKNKSSKGANTAWVKNTQTKPAKATTNMFGPSSNNRFKGVGGSGTGVKTNKSAGVGFSVKATSGTNGKMSVGGVKSVAHGPQKNTSASVSHKSTSKMSKTGKVNTQV